MTDRESLLAAIVADPDHPVPRLVFADYLDETGDPEWAELIRLQNGYFKHWTNSAEMQAREAELIRVVMQTYPDLPGVKLGPPVNGFPDELIFVNERVSDVTELEQLFARYPVTKFDLREGIPGWLETTGSLRRAVVINLSTNRFSSHFARDDFFRELAPTRLRCIRWQAAGLGDDDARAIAAAPALAGLSELNLSNNDIAADGCESLIRSPHLSRLRFIDLSGNPVGDAAHRLERRFGSALRLA